MGLFDRKTKPNPQQTGSPAATQPPGSPKSVEEMWRDISGNLATVQLEHHWPEQDQLMVRWGDAGVNITVVELGERPALVLKTLLTADATENPAVYRWVATDQPLMMQMWAKPEGATVSVWMTLISSSATATSFMEFTWLLEQFTNVAEVKAKEARSQFGGNSPWG